MLFYLVIVSFVLSIKLIQKKNFLRTYKVETLYLKFISKIKINFLEKSPRKTMPIYRTLSFSPFYLINKTFHQGKQLTGSIMEGKSNIQQLTSFLLARSIKQQISGTASGRGHQNSAF